MGKGGFEDTICLEDVFEIKDSGTKGFEEHFLLQKVSHQARYSITIQSHNGHLL